MALPVEILDHILSFLQSDPAALRACSESHPSLSQLAESHLYSQIVFKVNASFSYQTYSVFANLLSKRPDIAQAIRDLKIQVYAHPSTERNVVRLLEEISSILPMLLVLKRISLYSYSTQKFGWPELPRNFRVAFLKCLRLPSMQGISLIYLTDFPFTSLLNNECKTIKNLTVNGHCLSKDIFQMDSPTGPARLNQSISLESLSFCIPSTANVIQQFIAQVTTVIVQLRSLKIGAMGNYSLLSMLLSNYSNTLTSLSLDIEIRNLRMSPLDVFN